MAACRICEKKILVSSADFNELCIVCGIEFKEMMIAVAELSAEITNAYRERPKGRSGRRSRPGVPLEEIAIRMELNRIRKKE